MLSMEPLDDDDSTGGKICPNCGYVRKTTDTAPNWQCPACGVAYAKAAAHSAHPEPRPVKAPVEQNEKSSSKSFLDNPIVIIVMVLFVATPWVWHKLTAAPSTRVSSPAQASVIMYTTTTCPYCKRARTLFNDYGVPYYEYDINQSASARKRFVALNGRAVPLIFIGKKRITGYRDYQLKLALRKIGYKPVH